jgi:NAD(P)-dependent dehydrogenase (short-subunit alcohol dehydrogenase family)
MPKRSVALITNVEDFVGPPAVEALVEADFEVFCHDRSFVDEAIRQSYQAGHPGVRVLASQEPGRIVADVLAAAGAIHVLVSNDSYPAIVGAVEEASATDLQATLDALVVMPFCLVGAVVPHFKRLGGGTIIMITSPRAKLPVPGGSIPDAAREGANALVRSFARELAPYNIAVNAVAPNYFANEMYYPKARFVDDAEGRAFVARMVPAGRLGQPAEIAELIRFLATTNARFMTGSTLDFTGGWPVSPLPPQQSVTAPGTDS